MLMFLLLLIAAPVFVVTLWASPMLLITNFETFKHKAFSKLWFKCGGAMSLEMPPGTVELVAAASGLVLDLGPGTGTQLHLFTPSKITMIYGVEPAVDMHPELKRAADKCLLGEKYQILAAGAEPESLIPALAKKNLLGAGEKEGSGVFDTIVSLRVLCGVPDQEETARSLYRLLKPGGRLILCEHVKQTYPDGGDLIAWFIQKVYMALGWKFFLGGCCLDRNTVAVLDKVAGPDGWKEINVKCVNPCAAVPHIVGEMVKN